MKETGILPFGVEFDGKVHREFELRAQFVRDTVDIFEDDQDGQRSARNSHFFVACLFAGRLTRIGDIPKEAITPEMVLNMHQDDYDEILLADKRLEKQMATFRGTAPLVEEDGASPA